MIKEYKKYVFKKKRKLFAYIGFIIFVVFLMNQSFHIKKALTSYEDSNIQETDIWEYSLDDVNWYKYTADSKNTTLKGQQVVYFKTQVDYEGFKNPGIILYTKDMYYDVMTDNYSYSFYNTRDTIVKKSPGLNYNILEFPSAKGHQIIKLKLYKPLGAMSAASFVVNMGEVPYLYQKTIELGIIKSIISFLFIGIGTLLLIYVSRIHNMKQFFYLFAVISILIGLEIFSYANPLANMLYNNPMFWEYLARSIYTLICLSFMVYFIMGMELSKILVCSFIFISVIIILLEHRINELLPLLTGVPKVLLGNIRYIHLIAIVIFSVDKMFGNKEEGNKFNGYSKTILIPTVIVMAINAIYPIYMKTGNILNLYFINYTEWILLIYVSYILRYFMFFIMYVDTVRIEHKNEILEEKHFVHELLQAQKELLKVRTSEQLAECVIKNLRLILLKENQADFEERGISLFIAVVDKDVEEISVNTDVRVIAATSRYKSFVNRLYTKALTKEEQLKVVSYNKKFEDATANTEEKVSFIINNNSKIESVIYLEGLLNLNQQEKNTVLVFLSNASIVIKNLVLVNKMRIKEKNTIFALSEISEIRSKETGNHIKRVALYCKIIAEALNMPEEEVDLLYLASTMHDIGKLSTPDNILHKPGKLTDEEFEIMKQHAEIGYNMLKDTKGELMELAAVIALEHHEKYNGKGYYGMKGDDISVPGRIVAIADVFDALGSDRVYKKAWSLEKILKLFKDEKGEHFDPEMVDIFFENIDQFINVKKNFTDV